MGGSLGIVVMGDNSCSAGCGFKSRHRILDGHFSHFWSKNCIVCLKKTENKRKRCRGWPIFNKSLTGGNYMVPFMCDRLISELRKFSQNLWESCSSRQASLQKNGLNPQLIDLWNKHLHQSIKCAYYTSFKMIEISLDGNFLIQSLLKIETRNSAFGSDSD